MKPVLFIPMCLDCNGEGWFEHVNCGCPEPRLCSHRDGDNCGECEGQGIWWADATLDGKPFYDNDYYKRCRCGAIMVLKQGAYVDIWECMACDLCEVEQ